MLEVMYFLCLDGLTLESSNHFQKDKRAGRPESSSCCENKIRRRQHAEYFMHILTFNSRRVPRAREVELQFTTAFTCDQ